MTALFLVMAMPAPPVTTPVRTAVPIMAVMRILFAVPVPAPEIVAEQRFMGMVMPALTNAVLVGWELSVYIGGAFWLNAVYVALGELIVLYIFGTLLYLHIKKRRLNRQLFS